MMKNNEKSIVNDRVIIDVSLQEFIWLATGLEATHNMAVKENNKVYQKYIDDFQERFLSIIKGRYTDEQFEYIFKNIITNVEKNHNVD